MTVSENSFWKMLSRAYIFSTAQIYITQHLWEIPHGFVDDRIAHEYI